MTTNLSCLKGSPPWQLCPIMFNLKEYSDVSLLHSISLCSLNLKDFKQLLLFFGTPHTEVQEKQNSRTVLWRHTLFPWYSRSDSMKQITRLKQVSENAISHEPDELIKWAIKWPCGEDLAKNQSTDLASRGIPPLFSIIFQTNDQRSQQHWVVDLNQNKPYYTELVMQFLPHSHETRSTQKHISQEAIHAKTSTESRLKSQWEENEEDRLMAIQVNNRKLHLSARTL